MFFFVGQVISIHVQKFGTIQSDTDRVDTFERVDVLLDFDIGLHHNFCAALGDRGCVHNFYQRLDPAQIAVFFIREMRNGAVRGVGQQQSECTIDNDHLTVADITL